MNKVVASAAAAVADIGDGASLGIAGFGVAHRFPSSLITALRDKGSSHLTVYCNGLGSRASRPPTCSPTATRSAAW
jgi:3-oxoacid CoA-transferase